MFRRFIGPVIGVFAAVALWNCRVGNPRSAVPKVMELTALPERFSRPPTWEWGTLQNADGALLRIGSAKPIGGVRKGTIVVVGGYTEFAEKYFETFQDLLARGYAVATLDWRGQGGSQRYLANPQMAHSLGFAHDAADLARFLRQQPQPAYLLAHSMGGNIALRLLHDEPRLVRAAALSAPALRLGSRTGMPAWQARALSGLMIAAGLGEHYALGQQDWRDDPARNAANSPVTHDLARDQTAQRWFRERPALRLGGGTYRWAFEFFGSCAQVMAPDYLAAIQTPVLIGSAGQDTFVDASAHTEACGKLSQCQLAPYPGARHELLQETDAIRSAWLDQVDRFLASH
ncbi:MAG: alpha/beta hydrolase [Bryobacteraceae bacterium]|nr:alpha/beta hydrolase [Bryobacteraceae bacterium]